MARIFAARVFPNAPRRRSEAIICCAPAERVCYKQFKRPFKQEDRGAVENALRGNSRHERQIFVYFFLNHWPSGVRRRLARVWAAGRFQDQDGRAFSPGGLPGRSSPAMENKSWKWIGRTSTAGNTQSIRLNPGAEKLFRPRRPAGGDPPAEELLDKQVWIRWAPDRAGQRHSSHHRPPDPLRLVHVDSSPAASSAPWLAADNGQATNWLSLPDEERLISWEIHQPAQPTDKPISTQCLGRSFTRSTHRSGRHHEELDA